MNGNTKPVVNATQKFNSVTDLKRSEDVKSQNKPGGIMKVWRLCFCFLFSVHGFQLGFSYHSYISTRKEKGGRGCAHLFLWDDFYSVGQWSLSPQLSDIGGPGLPW